MPHEMTTDGFGFPSRVEISEPQLRWVDDRGSHTYLLAGHKVLGSAEGADVVVHSQTVARLHATVDVQDDGVWVRDLGTPEGTYINGIRVNEGRVPDGATIGVGGVGLFLYYNQNATELDLWPEDRFQRLSGRSFAMRSLFTRLHRFAQQEDTVLIQGENGTGKELIARAIHDASPRHDKKYVVIDCSALSESILEAELFGNSSHAYTDARARVGAIEDAEGGTVFLDEIGEMPLGMQPKLLRVIEARTIRRLGENIHRKVNVRFIAATNRDLAEMVNAGHFREDLFFRLAVLLVNVPPLRARKEDIPLLAAQFLPDGNKGLMSPELLNELNNRPWRGNVRELKNFVARAVVLGAREALAMSDHESERSRISALNRAQQSAAQHAPPQPLPQPPLQPLIPSLPSHPPAQSGEAPLLPEHRGLPPVTIHEPFKELSARWLSHLEREYMEAMLRHHGRDTKVIATEAKLDRSYVYRLLRKHNL